MKIELGHFYVDESTSEQREVRVALDDTDGASLFPSKWGGWSVEEKFSGLTALGDILALKYAARRGLRTDEAVAEKIDRIVRTDLS